MEIGQEAEHTTASNVQIPIKRERKKYTEDIVARNNWSWVVMDTWGFVLVFCLLLNMFQIFVICNKKLNKQALHPP